MLSGKPSAVAGTSQGAVSAAIAQVHLKSILLTLTRAVLGQPECYIRCDEELIDADGNIPNEGTRKFLSGYVERFVSFVSALPRRSRVRASARSPPRCSRRAPGSPC